MKHPGGRGQHEQPDFWLCSWDNPSIEPALRTEVETVPAFGKANGIHEITLGGWPAQDEEAACAMTALAAMLVGAKSVYRTPEEPRHVFLLITGVRWAQSG